MFICWYVIANTGQPVYQRDLIASLSSTSPYSEIIQSINRGRRIERDAVRDRGMERYPPPHPTMRSVVSSPSGVRGSGVFYVIKHIWWKEKSICLLITLLTQINLQS